MKVEGYSEMNPPIFLCGAPRSGTTLTLQLLAAHEELGWISQHQHVRPEVPMVSVPNRVYDLPLVGDFLYYTAVQKNGIPSFLHKYLLEPVEPWGFWEHFLEHFTLNRGGGEPPWRRTANDLRAGEAERMREGTRAILRAQGKKRFLSKYTDFPRIRYLKGVYPDARFVHVVRDGRAVAASYHRKIVTGEFIGAWEKREWWRRAWPEEWQAIWKNEYGGPLSFAAFQWGTFVKGIREEAAHVPDEEFLKVYYEDLVDVPRQVLSTLLKKLGLAPSGKVQAFVERVELENRNYKWKERYSGTERRRLKKCVDLCMERVKEMTT